MDGRPEDEDADEAKVESAERQRDEAEHDPAQVARERQEQQDQQ
jgi:hypothetical protein